MDYSRYLSFLICIVYFSVGGHCNNYSGIQITIFIFVWFARFLFKDVLTCMHSKLNTMMFYLISLKYQSEGKQRCRMQDKISDIKLC